MLFAGTGPPHTPGVLRKAGVTHPDRLLVLEPIPLTLDYDDGRYAVVEPARRAGVVWAPEAATAVVEASNGYPAHLQLFAHAASTAAIARTLGRTQQELSWLREELIEVGDVYAPKRGRLAMAVPLFTRYVLSHYERTRPEAATALLSLRGMTANAGLGDSSVAAETAAGIVPSGRQQEEPGLPPDGDAPWPPPALT